MRQHKKPCSECPFRRESAAGWLGTAMPEQFIVSLLITEEQLPCHKKIDYADGLWLEKFEADPKGKLCAGSLIMASNLCKRPRDPKRLILPADPVQVFSKPREFIDHHRNGPIVIFGSWHEEPELRDFLRAQLGIEPLKEDK